MERLRKSAEEGNYQPEKLAAAAPSQLPTIMAYVALAQAIFMKEKTDARAIMMSFPNGTPVKPFELSADKKISFTVNTTPETATSQNIVAVIEGSDPVLKGEYVALGAHYDHTGTATNAAPGTDTVFNGADDDGTGTVALLAMAEALTKAPRRPKRSVIFVWHMGEERGLWGSQYFTTFPTVPIDKIVAQLNIDMIGRSKADGDTNPRNKDLSGPNEVYVIGSKMMSTELGALSEAVNDAYMKMSFKYKYDDPKDPERFFYRSDHIQYARKNIPIIFYFTGVHADYHQVSDEVSRIDFPKFEKVTRTIYATLWEIAEMKTRPRVDKELPAEAKQGLF
jgi:Zn-dependent M28 family amino/carboxypeptidase